MIYKNFAIEHYKGIEKVEISLKKNDLLLLLGLNESGKTTILKAIESFDINNDPSTDLKNKYFRLIRNKSNLNSNESAKVIAKIEIDKPVKIERFLTEKIKSIKRCSKNKYNNRIINIQGKSRKSRFLDNLITNLLPYIFYSSPIHRQSLY